MNDCLDLPDLCTRVQRLLHPDCTGSRDNVENFESIESPHNPHGAARENPSTDQMKRSLTFFLSSLVAAACAPLVIPFTGGGLFFLLHEWFYPSVWGLPPLQSLIGVSINCAAVGYFFTWFYALPLVFILRGLNRYRLRYLLVASALPALSLPFWQVDWTLSILPVFIAGMSTAYAFWRLTNLCLDQVGGS